MAREAPAELVQADPLAGPWRLGRWTLKSRLLLAPMESVNDCAYRRMCFEQGAGFTFTEMVRPTAVARRNRSSLLRIDTFDPGTPTSVQFLGSTPKDIRSALTMLDELAQDECPHWATGIHGVDVNFGCPSTNVIRDGHGPALLNRPHVVREVFDALAEWRARTRLPIGVIGAKIRLGLNADDERRGIFLRVVRAARGRLDYVAVHGRHAREESKSSRARWEPIERAKEAVGEELKILGNGDVFTRGDAAAMMEQTGCDGVLAARGSIKTAGFIFNPEWQGDDPAVVAAGPRLEQRYAELSECFGGARPKIAEYHREAFRRIRARGSRKVLRDKWEALSHWLTQERKGHSKSGVWNLDQGKLAAFFSQDVRISYCCWSPFAEANHAGLAGAAEFLPFLAQAIGENKAEVHLPMEEAEEDPRQLIVGLSNTCTLQLLFGPDDRLVRCSALCARGGPCGKEAPSDAQVMG